MTVRWGDDRFRLRDGQPTTKREWPGVRYGAEHFKPSDNGPYPWFCCASCGSTHAPSNTSCNGLRDDEPRRCPAILGEMRCGRPLNHLGDHIVDSSGLRVDWHIKCPWSGAA